MLKDKIRKEKLIKTIIRANETMRKAPEIDIEILKLMDNNKLEEILENFEIILACYAINFTEYLKVINKNDIEERYRIKKINLDDLFNSL